MALPIFDAPNSSINYPVINVPTQEEFDAAVKADRQKEQEQKEEKNRSLPDSKPVLPQIQSVSVPQKAYNPLVTESTTADIGVPQIEVPFVGKIPVPPKEQVILAGTTATASVAAAIIGKSFVEWLIKKFKPIVQQLFARIKKALSKDLTDYELQLFFAYEHQKKVNKLLKKEFKKQKLEQFKRANNK